jgi:serine/threonine-protein kinase
VTAELGPGSSFGPYRIESVLGRGGMSVVYLAEDTRLGRRVAIKVLASELAADAAFRSRFVRESQLAAGLEHPNIVPVYEAGETDGRLFIAMRYVRGTDLRSLITLEGPLEPDRTIGLLRPVAAALDAAHRRGLVHRDVKPGNILIASDEGEEHVYLSDFGLSKHTTSQSGLTRTGQFMGTVDYVAPEQIQGQEVDGRADGYSLACVLYECLTSRAPYAKESDVATLFGHIQDPPPRVTEAKPNLPAEIDDAVARGMAKDRDARPRTCVTLIDEAARALGAPSGPRELPEVPPAPTATATAPAVPDPSSSPPVVSSPPSTSPRGRSGNSRVIAAFAAAGVAIAVLIVVLGLALTGGDEPSPGLTPGGATGSTSPTPSPSPSPSPAAAAFTDPGPISIPEFGEAAPYPASIEVSGLSGAIEELTVTLSGITHPFPDDVDVMLVGPFGQSVVLMADVGGSNPATAVTLTFDDAAPVSLRDRGALPARAVRPSVGTELGGGSGLGFEGGPPAPSVASGATLSVFDGTDPNGTWSLFVFDDSGGDEGEISGGWSLEIVVSGASA